MSEETGQDPEKSRAEQQLHLEVSQGTLICPDQSEGASVPLPSKSLERSDPLSTKLTLQECRPILLHLEKRILECERFVGDPQIISDGIVAAEKERKPAENGLQATGFDSFDSREKEWLQDIKFSISSKAPLITQIERIRRLSDQIFHGRPTELEKKCMVNAR